MKEYEIKNIEMAPEGHRKIEWVKKHMPILSSLEDEFCRKRPFDGVKISLSIHMEAKTAYLCKVLAAGGAELRATGSNVLSTQDDVAAALADSGIEVFAVHGADERTYFEHIEKSLEHAPNIIIDDGGDLVSRLHTDRRDLAEEVIGGCEETTTGILRLKAMEKEGVLNFPMMAVNDADCKHLFDNRYGTGQSVWDSIMRNTNLVIASKRVVVAGYGWCGRGIAMRAAAFGAEVTVTEVDPIKAMEAKMDGFSVETMNEAARSGDIFVTATGCRDTIGLEHMRLMKDGAILANAGHFNIEIDVKSLEETAISKKVKRKNIAGYEIRRAENDEATDTKSLNLLAEGRLVNIAAADGHPAEIMDLSFAIQALSAFYILKNGNRLGGKVIGVPREIDEEVARRRLAAWDIKIDELSDAQREYLAGWQL